MDLVFAKYSGFIETANGMRLQVRKGSHWPKDDPGVKRYPDMFSDDPRWGLFYTELPPGLDANLEPIEVESASAAPGEMRSVRRRG